jgi:hypothetical protein
MTEPLVTKTGKVLTEAEIEALAEQACRGYTYDEATHKWMPNEHDNPDCPIHGGAVGARLSDLIDDPYVLVNAETGELLKFYDPDFVPADVENPTMSGISEWTTKGSQAMTFATSGDAFIFWRTQSTRVPTRPDGKPNRPLTRFSVTTARLSEVPA